MSNHAAHVEVADDSRFDPEIFKGSINARLTERFCITHSTPEFEKGSRKHEDATLFCPERWSWTLAASENKNPLSC